jgi:hypothetical protein
VVRLTVNFTTTDVPSNTDLISFGLRTTTDDVYEVESSFLDGQPVTPFTTNDRRGYSWAIPDLIGSHEFVAELRMLKPVTRADMALSVQHIEVRSPAVLKPLSEDTIERLTAAQQQVTPPAAAITGTAAATGTTAPPTMTITTEPSATPSPPPAAPPVEATVAPLPIQPTASTALPTATLVAQSGGPTDRLVPLLLGGLFLLAALAIGGLLLTRRRRAPGRPVATDTPTVARSLTTPLPPVGAEAVTGVLTPVYLQLEGDAPQTFAVYETPFAIGRDPANNLPIDETFAGWETVSRHHALISRHERGYVIEDLGSQNGVRVNGRLTPKNLLRSGWQVSVGGVTFRFVDETQSN